MVIAINTRFLITNSLEGYGNYILQLFTRVATLQPQHQFYFILDRPYESPVVLSNNIHLIVVPPKARHPILWHYWYNVKVPLLLKKIKASLFISPDGFCSLTTKVPQITIIHDLAFLQYPKAIKKSHLYYYNTFTPKFIKKSKAIITVSEYSKMAIMEKYGTENNKINIVYNAAHKVYKPLAWQEHFAVKQQYTSGNEYFVCVCSIHPRKNIISLLKAFSIFKKWQKTNHQLVLIGRLAWKNNAFTQLLQTYKYKDDVILLGHLQPAAIAPLVAASYCAIYPSLYEGFGVPILEAMQCQVPIITSNCTGMLEAGGNAALYANPNDVEDIAAKMQQIYKDETLRNEHIQKGIAHVENFSWDSSALKMCTIINETIKI